MSSEDSPTTAAPAKPPAASSSSSMSGAMGLESSAFLTAAAVGIYTARVLWLKLKEKKSLDADMEVACADPEAEPESDPDAMMDEHRYRDTLASHT